eukprot:tig00001038_g6514.t1
MDDDLYEGFTAPSSEPFGSASLAQAPPANDNEFDFGDSGQQGFQPGYQQPAFQPPAAMGMGMGMVPPGTGVRRGPPSSLGRRAPPSQMGGAQEPAARPMTSVKAAGYTSHGRPGGAGSKSFDPLGARGPAPALQKKAENSPEEQAKDLEKKVNALIEESAIANKSGELGTALEKAKLAAKQERALCKMREQAGLQDQINIDLTYSVCFNLAVQFHANGLYTEALNAYTAIVKNKQYAQSGRLRVNMGNIYFEQKKYPNAIKMYRMALDQIPNTGKEIRAKIMRNIGHAFVRLGQFPDAIQSYQMVMQDHPDYSTGFNLLLCYFAMGDKKLMREGFGRLLAIKQIPTEDELEPVAEAQPASMVEDGLKEELRERQREATNFITMAAKLIAPVIGRDVWAGYDDVVEMLKAGGPPSIASELEMVKAVSFLKRRMFKEAEEAFKTFEKKESREKARASTNLSFLYFLNGDTKNAEAYAELAVREDKFNARALVNRGNLYFQAGNLSQAQRLYADAVAVESDCIEALYNLGLVNKKQNQFDEALSCFEKIARVVPSNAEVAFQLASLYEMKGRYDKAVKQLTILTGLVPQDAGVLHKLGTLFAHEEADSDALHYHMESYRYYPANMDVVSWLGAYFVKNEAYEQAMKFFERAAQIQPKEAKWRLMVASCHRRIGQYQQALRIYKAIHLEDPQNVECIRYLLHLCREQGQKAEADEYERKLRAAEAARAAAAAAPRRPAIDDDDDGPSAPAAPPPRATSAGFDDGLNAMAGPRRPPPIQDPDRDYGAGLETPPAKKKNIKMKKQEDDDFNDMELDDNLLPM